MDKHYFNYLNLSWWNTGLSPRGKPRSDAHEEHLENTTLLIVEMLFNKPLDFLALGEVSKIDAKKISDVLTDTAFKIEICDSKIGKGAFSQAYIYNASKINLSVMDEITFSMADRNYRVGHSIIIEEVSGLKFLIVVSHWPSKLQNENDSVRPLLASDLKRYIDKFKGSENEVPHVILMGDFNSEPFEAPLSTNLMATRDKTKVRQKQDLLYNPYWKKMGMSSCDRFCGSYYHQGGLFSNWRLLDQMMFTSPFITGNDWRLIEESVDIGLESIYEMVTNNKTYFDHLPIFAKLEKINEQF